MNADPQTYEQILRSLAVDVGLDPEELLSTEEIVVDHETIGLQLDGDPQSGDLVFFAVLGKPSAGGRERVLRTLLEANHFWIGTGGCTLGLQPETGNVILCGRIRLEDIDGPQLAGLLDAFADTSAYWRDWIDRASASAADTDPLRGVPDSMRAYMLRA